MPEQLNSLVSKVRSKNAGPFWLTIDIFCGFPARFRIVQSRLKTKNVAKLFDTDPQNLHRFDIEALNVIKFSLPRPAVQGSLQDRDMHGASWASLLGELEI